MHMVMEEREEGYMTNGDIEELKELYNKLADKYNNLNVRVGNLETRMTTFDERQKDIKTVVDQNRDTLRGTGREDDIGVVGTLKNLSDNFKTLRSDIRKFIWIIVSTGLGIILIQLFNVIAQYTSP